MYICTRVCMYICMCVCLCAYVRMYMCVTDKTGQVCVCVHACVYACYCECVCAVSINSYHTKQPLLKIISYALQKDDY